ncbi:hypothetical protein [Ectobacillus funiculus]|uniref:hypothetical protein n=1 Tax=Ectobacillus funiculus TaxID=137993 RepID=UPI00101C7AA9|nr:hypothetical protein [Ectobacillus funiculus]
MNLFIINTNKQREHRYEQEMLKERKCAAYRSTKHEIEGIQTGDKVLLYSNEIGIIARGIADGRVQKKEDNGEVEAEYFMSLDEFYELVIPIPYGDIVSIIKQVDPFFARPFNRTSLKFGPSISREIWEKAYKYV